MRRTGGRWARCCTPPTTRWAVLLIERRAVLEAAERVEQLIAERLDLTEVLPAPGAGHLHLVTQAIAELEDVFVGLGFTVAEGPEVETDWNNFGALNFPPSHPARDMYDTLHVDLRRAGVHCAPHPHVAGPGAGHDRHAAAVLLRDARPGLPLRHRRRHPHAGLPPDRGLGRRPGHHLRRPGGNHRRLHQGLLRRRLHVAPAPVVLPLHRALGRVRHPAARRHLAGAGRLRDGPPQRAGHRAASTPRSGRASPSASASTAWPRPATGSTTCASCSPTTSAS